jgi:hypothetical protein
MNNNQSSFEVYSEAVIEASSEYNDACKYLSECRNYASNTRIALAEAIYKAKQQNYEWDEKIKIANEKVREAGLKAAAAWAAWSSEQSK